MHSGDLHVLVAEVTLEQVAGWDGTLGVEDSADGGVSKEAAESAQVDGEPVVEGDVWDVWWGEVVGAGLDGAAESKLVGGGQCLPFGPDAVEVGVVEVEDGVGGGGVHVSYDTGEGEVAGGVDAEGGPFEGALEGGSEILEGWEGEGVEAALRVEPDLADEVLDVAVNAVGVGLVVGGLAKVDDEGVGLVDGEWTGWDAASSHGSEGAVSGWVEDSVSTEISENWGAEEVARVDAVVPVWKTDGHAAGAEFLLVPVKEETMPWEEVGDPMYSTGLSLMLSNEILESAARTWCYTGEVGWLSVKTLDGIEVAVLLGGSESSPESSLGTVCYTKDWVATNHSLR